MMCCKNCGWLRWVTTTGTSYYCEFVGGKFLGDLSDCCEAWKPTMRTNADRIRAMSDEELAKFIYEQADCFCAARYGVCIKDEDTCRAAWLRWLKEEVEHGN